MSGRDDCLLTINGGSSSVKFAVFVNAEQLRRVASGRIERIGLPDASFSAAFGELQEKRTVSVPDHAAAIELVLGYLTEHFSGSRFVAVGHRLVHGGTHFQDTQRITPEVLEQLRTLVNFAPEHLPAEIKLIEALGIRLNQAVQVACFDTAFHSRMPRVARLLPVPRRFLEKGVLRYGFHGLSYTYVLDELRRLAPAEAEGRLIIAHLGNGASMAAVRAGVGIDTSMGFTPAAGLVMSTRTGDLDPGVAWHLMKNEGLTLDDFYRLVNRQSGLLGVSEISSDMRDLLAREHHDARAAEAVELFCYQARKWIGALAAALGGLDTLVFTAGVGENSAAIRERICQNLQFLGVQLDQERNGRHEPIISKEGCAVTVRVLATDEELVIARETLRLLGERT